MPQAVDFQPHEFSLWISTGFCLSCFLHLHCDVCCAVVFFIALKRQALQLVFLHFCCSAPMFCWCAITFLSMSVILHACFLTPCVCPLCSLHLLCLLHSLSLLCLLCLSLMHGHTASQHPLCSHHLLCPLGCLEIFTELCHPECGQKKNKFKLTLTQLIRR